MFLSVNLRPVINNMRPSMAIHNTHQQNQSSISVQFISSQTSAQEELYEMIVKLLVL